MVKALGALRIGTATGFDILPAEFLKYATCTDPDGSSRNLLLPPLCKLFHHLLTQGPLPNLWKQAKISPLYKKGEVGQPGSYRMLAVNSILYRLYANVLRDILTAWCQRTGAIPETQFGFYPGRNTLQPIFILRHLSHLTRFRHQRDGAPSAKMYAAFMDFTQAYDTVDRPALWKHLEQSQLPPYLLAAIQALYDSDSYVLVDGAKRTPPIHPTRGVKQGCPLSPLLFALFINDFKLSRSEYGVHWSHASTSLSHLFYADDLVLLSTSPGLLNDMLRELRDYALRKGLTVNVPKSEVVIFNSPRSSTPAPGEVFRYGPEQLAVSPNFRYLGLRLHSDGSMRHADEQASKSFLAAMGSMLRMASSHGVKDRLDLVLRLYQSYALPLGLYASQVWATGSLNPRSPLDTATQQRHLSFLRHLSWVRQSTDRLALLAEFGQRPLQFYWWRGIIRFWNQAVTRRDNPVMTHALLSDLRLAERGCRDNWVAEVKTALRSFPPEPPPPTLPPPSPPPPPPFASAAVVDSAALLTRLMQAYEEGWGIPQEEEGFQRQSAVAHRPRMTYATCFRPHPLAPPSPDDALPHPYYLRSHAKYDVRRMARFRLGSHQLEVARGRFTGVPWDQRTCKRCSASHLAGLSCQVDDEHHMIFECEAFQEIRSAHEFMFENVATVRDFFEYDGDPDYTEALLSFISQCMQVVDEHAELEAEQPR